MVERVNVGVAPGAERETIGCVGGNFMLAKRLLLTDCASSNLGLAKFAVAICFPLFVGEASGLLALASGGAGGRVNSGAFGAGSFCKEEF